MTSLNNHRKLKTLPGLSADTVPDAMATTERRGGEAGGVSTSLRGTRVIMATALSMLRPLHAFKDLCSLIQDEPRSFKTFQRPLEHLENQTPQTLSLLHAHTLSHHQTYRGSSGLEDPSGPPRPPQSPPRPLHTSSDPLTAPRSSPDLLLSALTLMQIICLSV